MTMLTARRAERVSPRLEEKGASTVTRRMRSAGWPRFIGARLGVDGSTQLHPTSVASCSDETLTGRLALALTGQILGNATQCR